MQLQRVLGGSADNPAEPTAEVDRPSQERNLVPAELAGALAHLSIRKANEGLAIEPQNAAGYRILGIAYEFLGVLESLVADEFGGATPRLRRYSQALNAYHQALLIDPKDPNLRLRLIALYEGNQKLDLALAQIREYSKLIRGKRLSDEEIRLQQQNQRDEDQLSQAVSRVSANVQRQLDANTNRFAIAIQAYQQGCVLEALNVLESDPMLLNFQLPEQQLHAALLMEAGRLEEAFDAYAKMEGVAERAPLSDWRAPAALASLGNGRYTRAIDLWTREAESSRNQTMTSLLQTLPLAGTPDAWPIQHSDFATEGLYFVPYTAAESMLGIALCHLETGQLKEAERTLGHLLKIAPDTPFRALARFYQQQLTGESIEPYPPSQLIPVTPDMFATGAEEPAQEAAR
jgi:tetratricopeptide (TPR) repeat protein